jgi:hypothetical protein
MTKRKRKETKEEFKERIETGVAKAMRKSYDLVAEGRRQYEEAKRKAKELTQTA